MKKSSPNIQNTHKTKDQKKPPQQCIISYRKSCDAEGTGLSHFILMNRKEK